MRIGRKKLGESVFVIAEIGSNHNGDLDTALRMIDAAKNSGADAVKFQSFRADLLYRPGTFRESIRPYEVPNSWLPKLFERAVYSNEMEFLSTPFYLGAACDLFSYVSAYKVASCDITNIPLLEEIAGFYSEGKPILLSTGGANKRVVADAMRAFGDRQVVLLQCTVEYPTKFEDVNLRRMAWLGREFGCPVGLSDHTLDPMAAPVAATALGAVVIEKHFTLSRDQKGPDHSFALNPYEFGMMVKSIREAEACMGSEDKAVVSSLVPLARRGVYALVPIKEGEVLTAENVGLLRHGETGVRTADPSRYSIIIGREAHKDFAAGDPVDY